MEDLDAALDVVQIYLAAVQDEAREAVATNLAGWARAGAKGPWRAVVTSLLREASQTKRQRAA